MNSVTSCHLRDNLKSSRTCVSSLKTQIRKNCTDNLKIIRYIVSYHRQKGCKKFQSDKCHQSSVATSTKFAFFAIRCFCFIKKKEKKNEEQFFVTFHRHDIRDWY